MESVELYLCLQKQSLLVYPLFCVLRKTNFKNSCNLEYSWIDPSPFFFMTAVRLAYNSPVYLPL